MTQNVWGGGESTLRGDDLPKRGEKPLKEVNPRKKIIGGKT